MAYDYYLKQQKSLCEIKLNQILAENPQPINFPNRYSNHPLVRKYTHRAII